MDTPFYVGHRERLKEKLQCGQLADYEKLELLLTYAIPRRDVKPLARRLIQEFGNVYMVLHAPFDELVRVPGVGKGTAILIKLFHELVMVAYSDRAKAERGLAEEKFRFEFCRSLVVGKPVEEFHVLYLKPGYKLIMDEVHTRGTINQTAVYVREIAKQALKLNAWAVILVHNHPISDNPFSFEDVYMTTQVESALNQLNVILIDHLLVNDTGTVQSYRQTPWTNKSSFHKS